MKIKLIKKVSDLIDAKLDYVVAQCEKSNPSKTTGEPFLYEHRLFLQDFNPSTTWAHGGPIIERERIELGSYADQWQATMHLEDGSIFEHGPTPLIAAMRCYVASKLGNEINIPEALINK